jgi:hypothetical protein
MDKMFCGELFLALPALAMIATLYKELEEYRNRACDSNGKIVKLKKNTMQISLRRVEVG